MGDRTQAAVGGIDITPSDTAEFPKIRALYLGTGGDVRVRYPNGYETTYFNMQSGVVYPMQIVKVLATGTTNAANIRGLY